MLKYSEKCDTIVPGTSIHQTIFLLWMYDCCIPGMCFVSTKSSVMWFLIQFCVCMCHWMCMWACTCWSTKSSSPNQILYSREFWFGICTNFRIFCMMPHLTKIRTAKVFAFDGNASDYSHRKRPTLFPFSRLHGNSSPPTSSQMSF